VDGGSARDGAAGDAARADLETRVRGWLAALASHPRGAGTAGEENARALCAGWLTELGFTVAEHRFTYSRLPGRWGTPVAGIAVAGTMAASGHLGAWVSPASGLAALILMTLLLLVAGRAVARYGVLHLPFMRSGGVNLLATTGERASPSLWLVAHLDSKSQPVSIALRAAGVVGVVVTWLAMAVLLIVGIAGVQIPLVLWVVATLAGVVAAAPLIASTVGNYSTGALDNASGVAAVLAAAALLPADVRAGVGVAITTGEELGLAGARAWAAGRTPSIALNCDSVDDEGDWVVMYSGTEPVPLVDALVGAFRDLPGRAPGQLRARRLLPGVLTDHLALVDAGWAAVTLSRGTRATLRRIHTSADNLTLLRGDALLATGEILARAAMTLRGTDAARAGHAAGDGVVQGR